MKIAAILGCIILIVVVGSVVYISRYQIGSGTSIEASRLSFDKNIEQSTDVVQNFGEQELESFCRISDSWFKVKGSDYRFTDNEHLITKSGAPFENLLNEDKISKDQFSYYKNFLQSNPYVKCIREDLNLKTTVTDSGQFSINLEVNPLEGYIYISDGSVDKNINIRYKNDTYQQLDRIEGTNWYTYRYNIEYGAPL